MLGKRPLRTACIGLATGAFLFGCKISPEAQQAINDALSGTDTNTATSTSTSTGINLPGVGGAACYVDQYQQPAAQISHSVDILFIADTSGSMAPKRAKVADALYAFVGALPAGVDYRIGVVLAHGSNDPDSGRLYTTGSIPKVLDSSTTSQATIQSELKQIMLVAPDYNYEQGEMGSYALLKALSPARLAESRALGFFRPDAALAVITISDENDICAIYPSPLPSGYSLTSSPYANMPGMTSSENSIRQRDCSAGISTDSVINAIKDVQGSRPYAIAAVMHTDVNYTDAGGNDSYGWGYGSVVDASHGVLVDIGDGDYSSGLASVGALTTTKISLLSDFTLTHQNVDASTIQPSVDGVPSLFDYSASQNEVHLFSLGGALSNVDIQYCLNANTATATSTGTGTATNTGTSTDTSTSTGTNTSTSTSTSTSTAYDPNWAVVGFDGTTTSDTATLIWQTTGAPTTATIQVGTDPNNLTLRAVSDTNSSDTHVVTISGLSPNTTYYFQVTAVDANGVSRTSVVISKTTKP